MDYYSSVKAFLNSNSQEHFSDNELLELLIFLISTTQDPNVVTKQLLMKFKNLDKIIKADKDKLLALLGNDTITVTFLIVHEVIKRVLKQKLEKKNIIASLESLTDYLKYSMGDLSLEYLKILFLNKKNVLITEEVVAVGTVDQIHVYPRDIIKKVLLCHASAVILVHNHPSGSVEPSDSDITLTKNLVEICKSLNIKVHDHLIVSGQDYFSFKHSGFL